MSDSAPPAAEPRTRPEPGEANRGESEPAVTSLPDPLPKEEAEEEDDPQFACNGE